MLTKNLLKELFYYNRETGKLYNKIDRGQNKYAKKDKEVGYVTQDKNRKTQYKVVAINKKLYKVHRIIWILNYGKIPNKMQIDHINHDGIDNRLENLRLVNQKENKVNKNIYKNNTSGITGVSFDIRKQLWVAQIQKNNKKIHIGYFTDRKCAIDARKQTEIDLRFHKNHGKEVA